MTDTEVCEHFDQTRHVRYTEPLPERFVCQECQEIEYGGITELWVHESG